MGFGGPRSLDEVAPMLERIMAMGEGMVPPAQMERIVQTARAKYELIGGKSPNADIADAICAQLKTALKDGIAGKYIQDIEVGMMFTEPLLEDTLARLAGAGCERIIYLSITAYDSFAAWEGPYLRTVKEAAKLGITDVVRAPTFGTSSAYVQAHTDMLCRAVGQLGYTDGVHHTFVAHSLPIDDPHEMAERYNQQLLDTIKGIDAKLAEQCGSEIEAGTLSYVSIGARGGRWLKPTLEYVMEEAVTKGAKTMIVSPLGFSTDHMEVLYDLDIDAAKQAEALGLQFVRTPTLATSEAVNPALIAALTDSLQKALR